MLDTTRKDAHMILRRAQAAIYRYPSGFSGFRAGITFGDDQGSSAGEVEARSPSEVDLTLPGATDTQRQWVRDSLASELAHRWPSRYEERDGRYTLSLVPRPGHPLGDLIRFHDDPFQSAYAVAGDTITVVDRTVGTKRFTIVMQASASTETGQRLPTQYTVAFWDTETNRLEQVEIYSSEYALVDGVYLLVERQVVTADDRGLHTRRIELHHHVLLPGESHTRRP